MDEQLDQEALVVEEGSSPGKRALVRRFLVASGTQAAIDDGDFLKKYAFPGFPLSEIAASDQPDMGLQERYRLAEDALMAAYEKRRSTWQEEYERHVDHAFSEAQLSRIVSFLESAEGQNYLRTWSLMKTFVDSNTECLVETILEEAQATLFKDAQERRAP